MVAKSEFKTRFEFGKGSASDVISVYPAIRLLNSLRFACLSFKDEIFQDAEVRGTQTGDRIPASRSLQ